jgi:hypothetical protein
MATEPAESARHEIPVAAPSREIDLAVRPANRLVWLVRLFLRSLQITFWLSVATIRLPFLRLTRGSWPAALGGENVRCLHTNALALLLLRASVS